METCFEINFSEYSVLKLELNDAFVYSDVKTFAIQKTKGMPMLSDHQISSSSSSFVAYIVFLGKLVTYSCLWLEIMRRSFL